MQELIDRIKTHRERLNDAVIPHPAETGDLLDEALSVLEQSQALRIRAQQLAAKWEENALLGRLCTFAYPDAAERLSASATAREGCAQELREILRQTDTTPKEQP